VDSQGSFLADAGLHGRRIPGQSADWEIQTDESYRRVQPSLITVDHLAGPNALQDRLSDLDRMVSGELPVVFSVGEQEVQARIARAVRSQSVVGVFTEMIIRTNTAPSDDLRQTVQAAYSYIRSMGMESDPNEKAFANSGVHLIRRAPELVHRAKLPSLGLRITHDKRLAQGDTSHLVSANSAGETVFASSEGLNLGVYLLDAYLGPLLGAMTPFVWAFSAARTLGVLIYSLGCPIVGASGEASELLQLLTQQSADRSTTIPVISAGSASDAVQWWIGKLNSMFGVLSDPAVYSDSSGRYDPAKHLRALMTVEQLFRRVYSIQTAHRDSNARRVLLFTVLDTLHRLTNRDLITHCRPSFAMKTLQNLCSEMPASAAELLLPAAHRGVAALSEIQDGFFIGRQSGGDRVELFHKNGTVEELKADDAVACYVELLRNATHGHGTNRSGRIGRTDALLAQHNGSVGHDLALLGYLYLLDVLIRPDVLRKVLYAGGR
jgi:hypothetical protein